MESCLGHRQRLRERFARAGLEGFAAHEALELLLCYAIPRRDTKPLAYQLLARFGSLQGVLHASPQDLQAVPGIGENAATLLCLMLPLFRMCQQGSREETPRLQDTRAAAQYCRGLMIGRRYEQLYVLALDPGGKLLLETLISSGDEGETAVYPRLIVAALLRAGAAGAVLCHNHPGGAAQPSVADKEMTQALHALLLPLHIRLVDHVIVAGELVFSFRESGLI
ncbi:MAG: RadC family protein [Christensenellales bacterium]